MADAGLDLSQENDGDLLVMMSWQPDAPDTADAAFEEFHARHARYLFKVCYRAYGEELGRYGVQDLVQDTFWRAFTSAHTYEPRPDADPQAQVRAARAWLGTIAGNLVNDARRRQKRRIRLATGEEEFIADCPDRDEPNRELSPDERAVQEGLTEVLDERERDVLTTYLAYYDPESPNQYPPAGVIPELCERYRTTEENIRQIRRRARRKLKQFVEDARRTLERTDGHVAS